MWRRWQRIRQANGTKELSLSSTQFSSHTVCVIGCKIFEHDKTHPFHYTKRLTNNNCTNVCMHIFYSTVVIFFLFGSSFAYLIRFVWTAATVAATLLPFLCRWSWNVLQYCRIHVESESESALTFLWCRYFRRRRKTKKGWNFPMKMRSLAETGLHAHTMRRVNMHILYRQTPSRSSHEHMHMHLNV